MCGVLKHRVDKIVLVTEELVSTSLFRLSSGQIPARERSSPLFDILSELNIVLPFNKRCLFADIFPHNVRKAARLARTEARHSGLRLDLLEEFMLIDLPVQLP